MVRGGKGRMYPLRKKMIRKKIYIYKIQLWMLYCTIQVQYSAFWEIVIEMSTCSSFVMQADLNRSRVERDRDRDRERKRNRKRESFVVSV